MAKGKGSYYYNSAGFYKSWSEMNSANKKIVYPATVLVNDLIFLVAADVNNDFTINSPWNFVASKQTFTNNLGYVKIYFQYGINGLAGSSISLPKQVQRAWMMNFQFFKYFLVNLGQVTSANSLTVNPVFGDKNLMVYLSNSNTNFTSPHPIISDANSGISFGASFINKPESIIVSKTTTETYLVSFTIGLI